MVKASSDIAFTPAVKAVQVRRGSRAGYQKMEEKGGWATSVTPELSAFLEDVRSFYLATATSDGQPYIQHRGGPKGFLRVLDEKTLAFADFKGNRQYITAGNLSENPKAYIFIMDYVHHRRLKIWGTARMIEDDAELIGKLQPESYAAEALQAIVFTVEAWDQNCPQHIPQLLPAEDVQRAIQNLEKRIAELEAENARMTALLRP